MDNFTSYITQTIGEFNSSKLDEVSRLELKFDDTLDMLMEVTYHKSKEEVFLITFIFKGCTQVRLPEFGRFFQVSELEFENIKASGMENITWHVDDPGISDYFSFYCKDIQVTDIKNDKI